MTKPASPPRDWQTVAENHWDRLRELFDLYERIANKLPLVVQVAPQSPHAPSDSFYGAIPQEAPEAVSESENDSGPAFGRSSWDIPTSFNPRLGTLVR